MTHIAQSTDQPHVSPELERIRRMERVFQPFHALGVAFVGARYEPARDRMLHQIEESELEKLSEKLRQLLDRLS